MKAREILERIYFCGGDKLRKEKDIDTAIASLRKELVGRVKGLEIKTPSLTQIDEVKNIATNSTLKATIIMIEDYFKEEKHKEPKEEWCECKKPDLLNTWPDKKCFKCDKFIKDSRKKGGNHGQVV